MPFSNKTIRAIVDAISYSDDDVTANVQLAKDQLFVVRAVGAFLNLLASNYGVTRPEAIRMKDDLFRQFIPLMSFHPKLIL